MLCMVACAGVDVGTSNPFMNEYSCLPVVVGGVI